MPKYLIERNIPDLGTYSAEQLVAVARKSVDVLTTLGPSIQWLHSFVTADRLVCVYISPNIDLIKEHARLGGFPCDRITEVLSIVDPLTAEGMMWGAAATTAAAAG